MPCKGEIERLFRAYAFGRTKVESLQLLGVVLQGRQPGEWRSTVVRQLQFQPVPGSFKKNWSVRRLICHPSASATSVGVPDVNLQHSVSVLSQNYASCNIFGLSMELQMITNELFCTIGLRSVASHPEGHIVAGFSAVGRWLPISEGKEGFLYSLLSTKLLSMGRDTIFRKPSEAHTVTERKA
jgi:hypothetical protein